MMYKSRQLRRLFEVEVYKTEKKVQTRKETVIAWNAVDANRRANGEIAKEPHPICWVTWDDEPLRIDDTAGPTTEVITPTIGDLADW